MKITPGNYHDNVDLPWAANASATQSDGRWNTAAYQGNIDEARYGNILAGRPAQETEQLQHLTSATGFNLYAVLRMFRASPRSLPRTTCQLAELAMVGIDEILAAGERFNDIVAQAIILHGG